MYKSEKARTLEQDARALVLLLIWHEVKVVPALVQMTSTELPPGLKELLNSLPDYETTIPDEVTQHALRKSGYDCKDVRTLRLVSLATQKFVASVLDEAVNIHKRKKLAPAQHLKAEGYNVKDKRVVLNTEDLSEALREYGITAKPAPYYADAAARQQQ